VLRRYQAKVKSELSTYYERLRASYWFIPGIMITGAIVLSFVTIAIDEAYPGRLEDILGWIDIADPDGAHTFLSVVSSSMIGVTGVTFSITIVALVQASSQFGPRILNTFLRDRGNQFVLGTFVATYTYCLLVIRSVTNTAEQVFVPNFSLFIAILLAIFSVAVLVYFFHHVTVILQADHVIASLGRELDESIERIFPETLDYSGYGQALKSEEDLPPYIDEQEAAIVDAETAGYMQAIDIEALVDLAEEHDLFLRVGHRPGDFVQKEGRLIDVWPEGFGRENIEEKLRNAFIIGDQRLRINDIEFMVNQLVEIAVRALSPGINDPFTAISCIDQLGSGLSGLMARSIPHGYHYDSRGQLRLLTDSLTFSGIIEAAFNQIRQNAFSDVAVTIRLLDALKAMAPHAQTREQRDTLIKQAEMLNRSREEVPEKWDREDIEERFESVIRALRA
jgi:uncharacterized membrane protein